jgi:N-dimethylarginine dimethylaminohydrolase
MSETSAVLLCPPDYFGANGQSQDLLGEAPRVDKRLAHLQWEEFKKAFEEAGQAVSLIDPIEGLGEMVFCSRQVLAGLDSTLERVCLMGQGGSPRRERETAAFESWFSKAGWRIARLKDPGLSFAGGSDAIWHPSKRLVWGGMGFRSEPEAFEELSAVFSVPVILLKLVNERFCHLESCFCPLTPEAVLICPSAFDAESLLLILKIFPMVLTAGEPEALGLMASSPSSTSRTALVQRGASGVAKHMEVMGLKVAEVDASEYAKAGGGIHSLKAVLF